MTETGITVSGTPVPGNPVRATADTEERQAILAGLEGLLIWLRANEDVPLNRFGYSLGLDHPDGIPGVRATAAGLGLKVQDCPALVVARKSFGRFISYTVSAAKAGEYR